MSKLALCYLASDSRLYTAVGSKRGSRIVLEKCSAGCGLYGPYIDLPIGQYYAAVRFVTINRPEGRGLIDVCRDTDAEVITSVPFDLGTLVEGSKEIGIAFDLYRPISQCQVRLHCTAGVSATIESLEIKSRDVAAASIETMEQRGFENGAGFAPLARLRLIENLKAIIRRPFSQARSRFEAALIERLASVAANRTAEILAQQPTEGLIDRLTFLAAERATEMLAQHPTIRYIKQSGVPSEPYQIWLPNPAVVGFQDGDYMQSANCLARDFYHRDFAKFCQAIAVPANLHRKLWEFAFIWHHLRAEGVIRPGARGVGFGVGRERFPSLFAKHGCKIIATDAPPDTTTSAGWTETGQYSSSVDELFFPDILSEEAFRENVRFEFCDMNAIGKDIQDCDFCWSSCSFEHLGSIDNGLDFVVNSVEKTLKIGGVACHTSELNLSSNDETLDSGATVLFRRRDVENLIERLESRGHKVKPLPIEPGKSFIDFLVDLPPYRSDVHLRLNLVKYVTTSFGIVISRGC
jgi:hypothetical protein